MRALSPYVGTWQASTVFHNRDGRGPEYQEVGTYTVSWMLDSTYLEWRINLHDRNNSGRGRSMLVLTTYNADSSRYEQTYFYSGSPMRVFESGVYDGAAREFRTRTFIPREDGVRDEHVRTITTMPSDSEIVHVHYSRYSDEAVERNDFSATLRRSSAGGPAGASGAQ